MGGPYGGRWEGEVREWEDIWEGLEGMAMAGG